MDGPERLQKRVLLRLQQLDMLLVLMEARSIRATSEVVGMTQSAISKSLKELEAMMETPLFLREPGGLRPLPAAKAVARYAASTIMGFNALCAELNQLSRGLFQPVNFGVSGGASEILLDDAISRLPESIDAGAIHSHIKDPLSLLAGLYSGALDAVVTHVPRGLDRLRIEYTPVAVDTLIIVAHPTHRIFRERLPLWHYPWEAPQCGDPTRQRMDVALDEAGVPWSESVIEYSLPMIGIGMLRGETLMWVAESHVRPFLDKGLLLSLPLPFDNPLVQIGCLKLAGNTLRPAAEALWQQLTGAHWASYPLDVPPPPHGDPAIIPSRESA